MNKRAIALLCALMLSLLLFSQASAQTAVVNDAAAVLNTGLTEDISELASLLKEELGVALRVETRHFLGGKGVQAYTDQLLAGMPEPEKVILMVMVIGEEKYAIALGEEAKKLIGEEQAENLLLTWFRAPFVEDRAYDRALSAFLLALSDRLQAEAGVRLPPNALLRGYTGQGTPAPAKTVSPPGPTSWLDGIFPDIGSSIKNADRYQKDAENALDEDRNGGLSLIQIAIIGFVLYKIFGNKRPGGGGCGPLRWIFGTWGVSKIFGWRR